MYPELGFEEVETSKYVKEQLTELGLSYKEYAKTGLTVEIESSAGPGKTVLIRADMDALPLQEDTDAVYKSKHDGKMHACGHDTHIACLLGVATILSQKRSEFKGKALLVFQPAEEGPGGAKPMIEEGAVGDVNNPIHDACLSLHVDNSPVNTISLKDGHLTSAADEIYIDIKGAGGHGSTPHKAVDPVYIAGQLIVGLQGFITRTVDPMFPHILTVGKVDGGTRHNIIAETARMECTLRTTNRDTRTQLSKSLPTFIKQIAEAHGGSAEVEFGFGYDIGNNDIELNKIVREAAIAEYGPEIILEGEGTLGAEDYFEFGLGGKIPATMFWLGGGNPEKGMTHDNHSNFFDIDEDCLPMGTTVLTAAAMKYLNSN